MQQLKEDAGRNKEVVFARWSKIASQVKRGRWEDGGEYGFGSVVKKFAVRVGCSTAAREIEISG